MGENKFSKIAELAAKAKQEKAEKAQLEAEKTAAEKQEKHAERGDVENKLAESTALLEQRNSEITEAEAIVADLGETSGEIVDLLKGLKTEAKEIEASIAELTARKEALDAELGSEGEAATEKEAIPEKEDAKTEKAVENSAEQSEGEKVEAILNGIPEKINALTEIPEEWKARIQEAFTVFVTSNLQRKKEWGKRIDPFTIFRGNSFNSTRGEAINPSVAQIWENLKNDEEKLEEAEKGIEDAIEYLKTMPMNARNFDSFRSAMPESLWLQWREKNGAISSNRNMTREEEARAKEKLADEYAKLAINLQSNTRDSLRKTITTEKENAKDQEKTTREKYSDDIARVREILDAVTAELTDALVEKEDQDKE